MDENFIQKIASKLIVSEKLRIKTLMNTSGQGVRETSRERNKFTDSILVEVRKLIPVALSYWESIKDTDGGDRSKIRMLDAKLDADRQFKEFSELVGEEGPAKENRAVKLFRDLCLGNLRHKDVKRRIESLAEKFFKEGVVEESKKVFGEGGYEDSFMEFLPEAISFEVGPSREVLSITEKIGNEMKTWAVKAAKLAFLARNLNSIVRDVKEDINSSDEATKLVALMAAIVIETGIRPGAGQTVVKDPKTKEKITVETFGASSLKFDHVSFVRKNFVQLKFVGKYASENVADLKDADIVSALNDLVAENGKSIFVTKAGEEVGAGELRRYLKEKWGDITPSDFRKLQATQEFYNALKKQQDAMRAAIKSCKASAKEEIKSKIVEKIIEVLTHAAEEAQKKLSHDDWKTTIASYIDPRVVLHFLNSGGIDAKLEDIITADKGVAVRFDFKDFIKKAA